MAIIEQVYNLDLVPNGRPLVVNVSQYDQGSRALTFNFFKDNVAFTPPAGYAAHITGTKPDGTGFMYAMTVSGSSASVEVTQQMCAVAGDCPCEIRLIDGNSNVLGTANFTLSVERAAMDDDTVISDSDIPYFEDLATQAAASAASAAESAQAAEAVGRAMVVTITQSETTYTADKTFAEIMANINNGGQPVAIYNNYVLHLIRQTASEVRFGFMTASVALSLFSITNTDAVSYYSAYISETRYFAKTLGSAEATSDSTVYSGGYKLTVTASTITANSTAVVFFPNGDYSGNVTWITGAGKVDLYFDQNPNSKQIRVEWKTLTYSSATVS